MNPHRVGSEPRGGVGAFRSPGIGPGRLRATGSWVMGPGGPRGRAHRGCGEALGVLVQRNLCPAPPVTHGASSSPPWTTLAGTDCLLPTRVRGNEVVSSLGSELLWESYCKTRGC